MYEILKVANLQRPPATVEDLRFDIGSIGLTGPGSTEALIGVPHLLLPLLSVAETTIGTCPVNDWVDIKTPDNVWPKLTAVTDPACLPANAMLSFSNV